MLAPGRAFLDGAKVIGVSDSRGGIFNRNGLDPAKVQSHKQETGSVVGYAGSEDITNEELHKNPSTRH